MNTDEHRFVGKLGFTIAQSASRKGAAPRVYSERDPLRFICVHPPCSRTVAAGLCPSVVSIEWLRLRGLHCLTAVAGSGNQARGAAEPAR